MLPPCRGDAPLGSGLVVELFGQGPGHTKTLGTDRHYFLRLLKDVVVGRCGVFGALWLDVLDLCRTRAEKILTRRPVTNRSLNIAGLSDFFIFSYVSKFAALWYVLERSYLGRNAP